MIYFVQTPTGSIKIGKADDVESRLAQIENEFRGPMALLGVIPGGIKEERQIQKRFAHLRLARTEQFRPDRELMEFIGKPLLVGANPEAVEVMPKLRAVRLELPEDVHKLLRLEAAKQDTSLAAMARLAVEEYLKRKAGGK
jgi:hypothetical protein